MQYSWADRGPTAWHPVTAGLHSPHGAIHRQNHGAGQELRAADHRPETLHQVAQHSLFVLFPATRCNVVIPVGNKCTTSQLRTFTLICKVVQTSQLPHKKAQSKMLYQIEFGINGS